MLTAFLCDRPLLRVLLVLALFAGFLGTAVASHVSLTSSHSMVTAVDAIAGDLDEPCQDADVSVEDNASNDLLSGLGALIVHRAWLGPLHPMTVHVMPLQWHAGSELRPPIA